MTFTDLHATMMQIARANAFAIMFTSGRREQIEQVAHELAHALCLGGLMTSRDIGWRLRDVPHSDANRQELSTLRVEVAAMRRLGVRFDLRGLARGANWRWEPPVFARTLHAPLSAHERWAAHEFTWLVRATDAARRHHGALRSVA